MDNGEEILKEILEQAEAEEALQTFANNVIQNVASTPAVEEAKKTEEAKQDTHTQWALGGNGKYVPVGSTAERLPAGIYEPFATPGQWGLEALQIASDGIYTLPDMATEAVLQEVEKFWASEDKYRKHKLLYKRGLILWGPPGGGKTVTVKLLIHELVKRDGIVVVAQNISLAIMCLKAIRRIEGNRNLIVVLEDIDEIINYNGESSVLAMLDGENSIDNILHLATTNYPDRLGARIFNRPSRFDRRVYVGMPGDDARKVYFLKATDNGIDKETLDQWVADTKEMSIAHLRELVAAVYCLDQPYDDVISRLKVMASQVKVDPEFKGRSLGFKRFQASSFAADPA